LFRIETTKETLRLCFTLLPPKILFPQVGVSFAVCSAFD
jgi:hypothetical protein